MLTLAKDFGFSLGRDVDAYISRDKPFKNMRKYPRPKTKPKAIEYMERRGISAEVTERYALTTQRDHDNILVFPFFDDDGNMQFAKYRNMEYIKGEIWANVYGTDQIVRINPESGVVTGVVNCKGLLPVSLRKPSTDVLNGIAVDARGNIWLTGKYWPKMYRITLVEKK